MAILSHWNITAEGEIIRNGGCKFNTSLQILHLDDHQIFRRGVSEYCIYSYYPLAKITDFDNGDDALQKVKQCIVEGTTPDLIITDIIHHGLDGIEFIKQIRNFEESQKIQARIPILVISMIAENSTKLLLKANKSKDGIGILCKSAGSCLIAKCIDDLLHL